MSVILGRVSCLLVLGVYDLYASPYFVTVDSRLPVDILLRFILRYIYQCIQIRIYEHQVLLLSYVEDDVGCAPKQNKLRKKRSVFVVLTSLCLLNTSWSRFCVVTRGKKKSIL